MVPFPLAMAKEFSIFKEIDKLLHINQPADEESSFRVKLIKFVVKRGDNLNGILKNFGIEGQDVHEALETLNLFYNPKSLKIGQEISAVVHFFPNLLPHMRNRLQSLTVKTSPNSEIYVERQLQKNFFVSEKEIDVERRPSYAEGIIESSLYETIVKMGLSGEIMADVFHALSYDVDFERDIQVGNKIQVVYERFYYLNGEFSHFGKVLYATLELDDNEITLYRHYFSDGHSDFFLEDGTGVKKSLMKTPIPSASVSSNFGMRRHPISTYTRFHKGVDFRAPRGTPILAAGDGVIQFRRRKGGYGNYLMIRHGSNLSSAYGHISRFAPNLAVGDKVSQGQVVAYVGSTGRATGPHLHFELLINGQRVNPLSYHPTPGVRLKGQELETFNRSKAEIGKFLEQRQKSLEETADAGGDDEADSESDT